MNPLKVLLINCFCLLASLTFAQDTTYYNLEGDEVDSLHLANEYEIVIRRKADTNNVVEKRYYKSGQIKSEIHYNPYKKMTKNGIRKEWYENGQLKKDIVYAKDTLEGQLLTYWENGQLKRKDNYEKGELIEGNIWDSTGKELEYYDFMILPEFPGGLDNLMRFMRKEVKYPGKAKRKNIEGRVFITFIVDKEGYVNDVEVKKGVHELLDNEAVRAVKEFPQFKAGKEDGEKVNVRFILPINFNLK